MTIFGRLIDHRSSILNLEANFLSIAPHPTENISKSVIRCRSFYYEEEGTIYEEDEYIGGDMVRFVRLQQLFVKETGFRTNNWQNRLPTS